MTITASTPPPAAEAPQFDSALEKATVAHVENVYTKNVGHDDDALAVGEQKETLNALTIALSATAAVSGFCFGYDTGVISASLVSMGTDLGHALTSVEKEWISTATSVGALIGSLVAGWLTDRIGRKWVLAVGDVWFIMGAILICSGFSVAQVIVGRVVLGFGVGTAAAIAPVYIAELAPTKYRGMLVTVQAMFITGGQFIAYCIGIPLTGHHGWRIQFAIGIVPALAQGIMIHFLPESPRYDVLKGRVESAHKTLRKVYPKVSEDYLAIKLAALEEVVSACRESDLGQASTLQQWKIVFKEGRYRRPALLALGVGIFQQLCGFNSLMYYSATMFKEAGFDNPTATGLIVSGTNWFFSIVSMMTSDRVGRRRLLLITYPGMILGLALASVSFWKMTQSTGGRLIDGATYPLQWSNMMLGMMVIFIAFYATGSGNITWTVSEFFPLELRGLGASILAGGVWAANIVISSTFLTMMNAIGPTATFALYAGICVLGLIFIFCCYPEPAGLSLEELEEVFRSGFGVRKSKEIRQRHKQVLQAQRE